jgi:hypothetical protein
MTSNQLREKLREEILNIPDSRLQEVFDFIHYFRLGLESDKPSVAHDIMSHAGAWEDMQDFDVFEADLRARRRAAFKTRRNDETGND